MPGLLIAAGLALAAEAQRPIRAGCIDVRGLFVAVELRGVVVERAAGGGRPATYDLALDPTVCVDDGALANPDHRVAQVGLYASNARLMPAVRGAVGRRVRVRGQAFTSFAVQSYRPIMVVNVQAVEAADR